MKGKKNGFGLPLHPYQLISYILTVFNLLIAPLVLLPLQSLTHKIMLTVLYFATQFVVFVLGYKATNADPTDSLVYI
jgi:hypothetical protein